MGVELIGLRPKFMGAPELKTATVNILSNNFLVKIKGVMAVV